MKPLQISLVSAAILAAASFGAQAQQDQKPMPDSGSSVNRSAPSQGAGEQKQPGGAGREAQGGAEGQGGGADRPKERAQSQDKPQDKQGAEKSEKSGDKAAEKPGDGMNKAEKTGDDTKKGAQSQDNDRSKAAGQDKDSDRKAADQNQGGDRKSADQDKGGKPDRQASKEIKPEQKTVIKETIVREKIRPERINVQVRVGVAIPRTVVLHALPPTIIEVYPSYSRYKLVMVDDNTLLIIDPVDWTIVDVIEV